MLDIFRVLTSRFALFAAAHETRAAAARAALEAVCESATGMFETR